MNGSFLKFGMLMSLVLLVGMTGCERKKNIITPAPGRPIGPPMGKIAFCDYDRAIGTVNSDGGGIAFFAETGTGGVMGEVEFGLLWSPSILHTEILTTVSNPSGGSYVRAIRAPSGSDSLFDIKTFSENAVTGAIAWSAAGSRLAFIEEDAGLQKVIVAAEDIEDTTVYGTVDNQQYRIRKSRISMSGYERVVVALENVNQQSQSMIAVFERNRGLVDSLVTPGLSPQYSLDGNKIAFIDGSQGADSAGKVIVTDDYFNNPDTAFFADIAAGATSLAWSPDQGKIALYAGVFSGNPRLIVIGVESGEAVEIDVGLPMVVGEGDDLVWACPSWNPTSDELLLMVKRGDIYSVIATTLNGSTRIIYDNLAEGSQCRPDWSLLEE